MGEREKDGRGREKGYKRAMRERGEMEREELGGGRRWNREGDRGMERKLEDRRQGGGAGGGQGGREEEEGGGSHQGEGCGNGLGTGCRNMRSWPMK